MPSRQNPRKYPLGRCRGMMAQERNLPVALRGDPIELDDPARPDEGFVTMPRVFSPFEHHSSHCRSARGADVHPSPPNWD